MQRRTAIVTSVTAIVVGCAAAVSVPLVYAAHSSHTAAPVQTFGAGAPTRLADQRPSTPQSDPTSALPSKRILSTTIPKTSTPSTRSGRKATRRPGQPKTSTPTPTSAAPAGTPIGLTISGTGISARIIAVGVDALGNTEIPERVDTVGWYRFGPQPGASAGSVVLVGHVDSAQQGEGAFFRLQTVRAGAIVSVTGADHHVFRYRVVGRQEYPKTSVPLAALFTQTGAPHLTLITCGGSFDASIRHYRDNVVVTAVPIA